MDVPRKTSPVCVKLSWPEHATGDLIQSFLSIKEKLGQRKGTSAHIQKMRNEASSDVEVPPDFLYFFYFNTNQFIISCDKC